MRELARIALWIEWIGMFIMLALALRYYRDFRRGREGARQLMVGPLLLGLGVAFLVGRSFYFRHLPVIPLTAGTPAYVAGSILSFVGFAYMVRLWWRKRRDSDRRA